MTFMLYDIVSIISVLCAILVITSSSPVVSVLYLICVFVSVAAYLIILGISFVGISYIVVYVGAVAVLILFVIMMINMRLAELSAIGTAYTKSMPISFIIGFAMFYQLFTVIPTFTAGTSNLLGLINSFSRTVNSSGNGYGDVEVHEIYQTIVPDLMVSQTIGLQVQHIGTILYTTMPMWLIITSIILLLAIVAPILLSRNLDLSLRLFQYSGLEPTILRSALVCFTY